MTKVEKKVQIIYFGVLAEVTGCSHETVSLVTHSNMKIAELVELLKKKYPNLKNWDFQVAQDMETASFDDPLFGKIALLPPFSGASLSESFSERYSRQLLLPEIGEKGQSKLLKSRVLVVGAGGLGCPALHYLAAAGVGKIGIIDFDVVEVSNLHRQTLFDLSSIGKKKALVAREKILGINPTIVVKAYPKKLTPKNVILLFKDYDLIVDATDDFESRYLINDASRVTGKPLVYGAIYKFEGQVSVFNYKDGPSYRCLFPTPPTQVGLDCNQIGVLGVLPGIIGVMQANEVLKIILGLGGVLSGKLCHYSSLSGETRTINLKKNQEQINKILKMDFKKLAQFSEEKFATTSPSVTGIFPKVALERTNVQLIDVREVGEKPVINYPDVISIPLSSLRKKIDKRQIDLNRELILFCQSGQRSKQAKEQLNREGIACDILYGGAIGLVKAIKELKEVEKSYD